MFYPPKADLITGHYVDKDTPNARLLHPNNYVAHGSQAIYNKAAYSKLGVHTTIIPPDLAQIARFFA